MQEFESCVNELSVGIQQRREASGPAAISQKLCELVDGKTMREVLVLGYRSTAGWVPGEIEFHRANIKKTEEALGSTGSDSRKAALRDYLAMARDNVARLEARLEKARMRLAELEAQ